MNRKKNRIGRSTWILGIAFLALIACGPTQRDNKQTELTPSVKQTNEEPILLEINASSVPLSAEESDRIVLNPPHGEPGHRCEIPVGSPLNATSSVEEPSVNNIPATQSPTTTTEAVSGNNSMTPTVENARRLNATQGSQKSAPATGEKPKINPPHGQPWHRCDVAVGSPLP
jgi:hypothetical protein